MNGYAKPGVASAPVLLTAANLYRSTTGQMLDIRQSLYRSLPGELQLLSVQIFMHILLSCARKAQFFIRVSLITQIKYHFWAAETVKSWTCRTT